MVVLLETSQSLSAAQTARRLGWPVDTWPGNCYAVAVALVDHHVVEGAARYGHWLGPVAESCTLFRTVHEKAGFCNHGWVEQVDGLIVDPTRWVFEGVSPYIFVGVDNVGYYDVGGNCLRLVRLQPPPAFNPELQRYVLDLHPVDARWLADMLGNNEAALSVNQVFWLANLPLQILGQRAATVYRALIAIGLRALIPIDNREYVLGKRP